MSLITEVAYNLFDNTLTPELVAEWQGDRGVLQRAWDEETDVRSMISLCARVDLALGTRAAYECASLEVTDGRGERVLSIVKEWVDGEEIDERELGALIANMLTRDPALNPANAVLASIAAAEMSQKEISSYVLSPANAARRAIRSIGVAAQYSEPSAIRRACPAPPALTFCHECHRPATYLNEWASSRRVDAADRRQIHWEYNDEMKCQLSRLLAEYVRADVSPISLTFDGKKIVAGKSGLEELYEVTQSSVRRTNAQRAKEAWVNVERVLTGGSWNPEFMPK